MGQFLLSFDEHVPNSGQDQGSYLGLNSQLDISGTKVKH